jgi:hypothetical protein
MPASTPKQYFFADGDRRCGPFTLAQLRQFPLKAETMVWREGLSAWAELRSVPELWAAFAERLVPPSPAAEMYRVPEPDSTSGDSAAPSRTVGALPVASVVTGASGWLAWCLPGSIFVALPLSVGAIVLATLARRRRQVGGWTATGLGLGIANVALSLVILGITLYVASTTRPAGPLAPTTQGRPS